MNTKVDFSYSIAPPHRMVICAPEGSDKTLLDLQKDKLTVSWSYENLSQYNHNIWKAPVVDWKVEVTPTIEGKIFAVAKWQRADGGIPNLINNYEDKDVNCVLNVIGSNSAMMIKVTFENNSTEKKQFGVICEHKGGWVISNPAWIDGENANTLLAMQFERPDRILAFGIGADHYPLVQDIKDKDELSVPLYKSITETTAINWQKAMVLDCSLESGEIKSCWIIRPYKAYTSNLPELSKYDWQYEFDSAQNEWLQLLKRAVKIQIPDTGVLKGFYACLSDAFVMREKLADGHIASTPGTEVYRSPNAYEPILTAILLDQMGLHKEAEEGLLVHLEAQGDDGNWADPKGWIHHMWCASGMKAWGIMQHYKLTRDVEFLMSVYPRMIASSFWQNQQRAKTRVLHDGQKSVVYGLMPRGMGDCGLMNDNDFFGVFYPHNFLAVFADGLSLEAAKILGKVDDIPKLKLIYETSLKDLQASLKIGAIQGDDYIWIPGVPNKVCGSRCNVI